MRTLNGCWLLSACPLWMLLFCSGLRAGVGGLWFGRVRSSVCIWSHPTSRLRPAVLFIRGIIPAVFAVCFWLRSACYSCCCLHGSDVSNSPHPSTCTPSWTPNAHDLTNILHTIDEREFTWKSFSVSSVMMRICIFGWTVLFNMFSCSCYSIRMLQIRWWNVCVVCVMCRLISHALICVCAPLDSLCDLDVPVINVELGEILDEASWNSELLLDSSSRVESEEESESTALWHVSTHNPLLLLFIVLLLCVENIPDGKSHENTKLHQHVRCAVVVLSSSFVFVDLFVFTFCFVALSEFCTLALKFICSQRKMGCVLKTPEPTACQEKFFIVALYTRAWWTSVADHFFSVFWRGF